MGVALALEHCILILTGVLVLFALHFGACLSPFCSCRLRAIRCSSPCKRVGHRRQEGGVGSNGDHSQVEILGVKTRRVARNLVTICLVDALGFAPPDCPRHSLRNGGKSGREGARASARLGGMMHRGKRPTPKGGLLNVSGSTQVEVLGGLIVLQFGFESSVCHFMHGEEGFVDGPEAASAPVLGCLNI